MQEIEKPELDPYNIGNIDLTIYSQSKNMERFEVLKCWYRQWREQVGDYEWEIGDNRAECTAGEILCFDKEPPVFIQDIERAREAGYSDYEIAQHIAKTAYTLRITKDELWALRYEKDILSLYDVNKYASDSPTAELIEKLLRSEFADSLSYAQIKQIINEYNPDEPRTEEYLVEPIDEPKNLSEDHTCTVLKAEIDINAPRNFFANVDDYRGLLKGYIYFPEFQKFISKLHNLGGQTLTVDEMIEFYRGIRELNKHRSDISQISTETGDAYIDEKKLKNYRTNERPPEKYLKNNIKSYIGSSMSRQGLNDEEIGKVLDHMVRKILLITDDISLYQSNRKPFKLIF
ncbi:MAG: hypothetical protein FWF23_02950 [Alphaproteobacteria bacterium]|nr:hypothetical protein [Alphaproteobacteria bacterium]MCL2505487.1 hypothetical protein [Alphaproteobacteria bacterium]